MPDDGAIVEPVLGAAAACDNTMASQQRRRIKGSMLLKALLVWTLIAAAEVLHGVARVRWLNLRVGDRRARQIAVFTGSALLFAITWLLVPWLGVTTSGQCLAVGGGWLALMLAFEIAFGRLVFRAPWQRIAADFDPRQGGLLAIGMAILFLAPLLAARLRGLI